MGKDQTLLLSMERIVRGAFRRVRNVYYSRVLRSMGEGCQICGGVRIAGAENIVLGRRVSVNDGVIIQSCEGAEIRLGNDVTLSYGAKLITGGLLIGGENLRDKTHQAKPIVVEDGAWIGAGSIILSGVTVGTHAVVAAGSVVTHDVPPYTVMGGVPAKAIRVLEYVSE